MKVAVRDRPIPFSPPMMAAVRRAVNPKTQTRRIVAFDQPQLWEPAAQDAGDLAVWHFRQRSNPPTIILKKCRFGAPGDRLWTRERFGAFKGCGEECKIAEATYVVLDDGTQIRRDGTRTPGLGSYSDGAFWFKWRPPMFMPRWASRLTLDITDVRVQRVEDISEEDAIAEGFENRAAFLHLFYDINERAPRGSNPWVFAITFTRAHASPSAVVAPNPCAP